MFSFSTPCLRWKLVLAVKMQNGWPGFAQPYVTRYLNKLVVITSQPSFGYPNNQSTTTQQAWVTDRLTGVINSADGNANANADFPYGETLNNTGGDPSNPGYESWQVTDTQFIHTINNGYFVITTTVTLSNPYDFATLDADTNALLSSVSLASMPWNSLVVAQGQDVTVPLGNYDPDGNLMDLLPAQVTYPGIIVPGPNTINSLNAAAWAIWAPGLVSSQNYFPNGYSKLIGYIAMAGNYCQKTYFIDLNQSPTNQTCQSGIGSCASPFKVTPPPISPGANNAYVLVIPNCQCGS